MWGCLADTCGGVLREAGPWLGPGSTGWSDWLQAPSQQLLLCKTPDTILSTTPIMKHLLAVGCLINKSLA